MSTKTTSQVVRRWYENLAKGNVQAVIDGLAEDVEWEIPKTEYNKIIPWVGKCIGREQVAKAFELRDEAIRLEVFEPRDFIVEDNRAVVFVFERSICKRTGKLFELEVIQVLTVRDGKIAKWKAYYDPSSIVTAFSADLDSQLIDMVKNNNLDATRRLLELGADANTRDALTGLSVLMMAACQANAELVKLLMDAGADVLTTDSKTGATALHKACQGGNREVAGLLVEKGAFVDAVTPTMGHTPIMDALWYKWPAMVKYLVDQNANLNLSTHYGFSMMEHFEFELNVNILGKDKLLEIDQIFKARQRANEQTIQDQKVMASVNKGNLEGVQKLIQEGADVNVKYPIVNSFLDGHTPLLVAARDGHTEIVRELLKGGAEVIVEDWVFKGAPIHKATYNGNPEILKMLVDHPDIDLDVQGPINGYTPLHDALWHGYSECSRILIEAGADLTLKGHDGKTPLDIAIDTYGGGNEIVQLIQSKLGMK